MVSVWFAGRERGLAAGVYATAPPVGLALAFATANSVVLPVTDTWRGVSLVYGAIILLVVCAWWLLARDPQPSSVPDFAQSAAKTESTRSVFALLIRLRNVQILLLISLGLFALMSGLSAWAPAILEEKGMTLSRAGLWTAVATLVSIVSVDIHTRFSQRGTQDPGHRDCLTSLRLECLWHGLLRWPTSSHQSDGL